MGKKSRAKMTGLEDNQRRIRAEERKKKQEEEHLLGVLAEVELRQQIREKIVSAETPHAAIRLRLRKAENRV